MNALLFILVVFGPYGVTSLITDVAVFIARRRRDYYRRRLEALEQVGRLAAARDQWNDALLARVNSGAEIRAAIPTRVHEQMVQLPQAIRGALDALEEGCFCDENPYCLCCKAREDLIVALDPNACPGCTSEGLAHFCGYESPYPPDVS